jgi:hypothetical protein
MGKGGARLVTTRSRVFSTTDDNAATTGDGDALTQTLSAGATLSEPLGGAEAAQLSRAKRAKIFMVERGNAYIYLISALSFIPASFGFMTAYVEYYTPSVWVFIIGSVGFTWVAGSDARETWKLHTSSTAGSELPQFVNCVAYVFGSVLFFFGSILFLPGQQTDTVDDNTSGDWMFVVGSAVFTLAALLNVTEVRRNTELDVEQFKLVITVLYTIGGVLFTVGSAFFHPALKDKIGCTCLEDAGSWLFVVGSMCYFAGAVLNIKKIGMEEGATLEGVNQGGTESEGNFLGRLSFSAPPDLQRAESMDRTPPPQQEPELQLSTASSAQSSS